jgi:asparagine synthase (glutamine-hydrolysing)
MCGIVGINRRVAAAELESATLAIAHRGPDDVGIYINDSVSIGHRRLAIQDISADGHQPMSTPDGLVWIVFNGEIYNHWALRRELGEYHFRSSSDTETLLYGYLKYGKSILGKLNGIFAFAIYDGRSNDLFVARDQLGVKPLYYFYERGMLVFASELKAITCFRDLDLSRNYKAFVNYVHFLWSPGQDTPFENVKKLPPGHYLTCRCDGDSGDFLSVQKYYELPFDGTYSEKSEADLIDEFDARLTVAIERQLLSDVPVGFFLSGGLDSSLIAAIARRNLGREFNCYTIRTEDKDVYEGMAQDCVYARRVAKYLNVNLIEVDIDVSMLDEFDNLVWHMDEPQSDPAAFNVKKISRQARCNGDVVLLGGIAADDLFSGYRRHQALRLESTLSRLPRQILIAAANLIGEIKSSRASIRKLRKLTSGFAKDSNQRLVDYFAWLDLDRNKNLFLPKIAPQLIGYHPGDLLRQSLTAIPHERTLLNQMLFWELKFFLADHNLNYTDKAGMSEGVEIRVPYLDVELVEFACRLPIKMKMRGRTTKYILRRLAERYLPREIISRRKAGFGAPVRSWFYSGAMDRAIAKYLSPESLEATQLFSSQAIHKLVEDSRTHVIDGAYSILAVMAIQSWVTQFCDQPRRISVINATSNGMAHRCLGQSN